MLQPITVGELLDHFSKFDRNEQIWLNNSNPLLNILADKVIIKFRGVDVPIVSLRLTVASQSLLTYTMEIAPLND